MDVAPSPISVSCFLHCPKMFRLHLSIPSTYSVHLWFGIHRNVFSGSSKVPNLLDIQGASNDSVILLTCWFHRLFSRWAWPFLFPKISNILLLLIPDCLSHWLWGPVFKNAWKSYNLMNLCATNWWLFMVVHDYMWMLVGPVCLIKYNKGFGSQTSTINLIWCGSCPIWSMAVIVSPLISNVHFIALD